MSIEEPNLATQYGIFFQPFTVASILVGIYGLTITVKSLEEIAPGKNNEIIQTDDQKTIYICMYTWTTVSLNPIKGCHHLTN